MAFQQSTAAPRRLTLNSQLSAELSPQAFLPHSAAVEESQEWILFSPSQAESSTNYTQTTRTAGISRVSELASLNTAGRCGRLGSSVLEEEITEDGELDDLDEGLQAFRDPNLYQTASNQNSGAVLPTHDGLGMFPASSTKVQDQLWQHEQYNPKRKHDGHHRRPSSSQRRLETVEELDAQVNEDKRLRIERWRIEQSQALMEEVEKETRRRQRHESSRGNYKTNHSISNSEDVLGTTPKQSNFLRGEREESDPEPFWRRITRRFIRDVIGIDEPLLSVILGETLPEETIALPPSSSVSLPTIPEDIQDDSQALSFPGETWRDRLLQRIARELGVFVHEISPHPGAFSTYSSTSAGQQYAGIPISSIIQQKPHDIQDSVRTSQGNVIHTSSTTPNFQPTVPNHSHAASWGLEEESKVDLLPRQLENFEKLRREREYWERELDVKMVFRFLKSRFSSSSPVQPKPIQASTASQDGARRAAIIRQHHPLVARAHRSPVKLRKESKALTRRPSSSCASESIQSSRKASLVWSGSSSRNYWDIGGSIGSGSILASGGLMGAWGEV